MNYAEKANLILELVGGSKNISTVTHCMTRLRLNIKDMGLIKKEEIEEIEGIIGTKEVANQFQIIVGPDVDKLYKEFSELNENRIINKNNVNSPNQTIKKYSIKNIINNILDAIGACVVPMLPIITCAGLLKMIVAVLGPTMLNLLPKTNDFIQLLSFVGDAGFYFFPVYVAYAGAKKFGCNVPLALFISCILLHPTLGEIVKSGKPFSVYGIPMTLTIYSTSFIPMILITFVMSYIERILDKIIPNALRTLLFPLLLILIMLPISLCVLGPLGVIIGQGIANVIVGLNNVAGPLATALIAATWPLLIATGMHQALIAVALTYISTNGYDDAILVGGGIALYAMMGICLAYMLRSKNTDDRAYATTSFITLSIGGVSEPTIFGILLKIKKTLLYLFSGGIAGGLYAGFMNVVVYLVPAGNILACLGFTGENPNNLIHGVISSIIAFAVSFILAMIFGFDQKERRENDKNIISK